MTVYGDGPAYQEYMGQWIADHPGCWVQCPDCGFWRMTVNKKGRCPNHPMPKPGDRVAESPQTPTPPKKIRGSRDRRGWANY